MRALASGSGRSHPPQRACVDSLYGALIHDVDVQLSRAVHAANSGLPPSSMRPATVSFARRSPSQFRVPCITKTRRWRDRKSRHPYPPRGNLLADAQRCEIEHDDRMRLRTPGIPFVQRRYQGNAIRSRNGNLADYVSRSASTTVTVDSWAANTRATPSPTSGNPNGRANRAARFGRAVERLGCGWRGGGWCDGRCIRIGRAAVVNVSPSDRRPPRGRCESKLA